MNLRTIDPVVLGRLVDLLYRNVRLGQLFSIINASLLVWVAQSQIAPAYLFGWWGCAVTIAVVRLWLAKAQGNLDPATRQAQAPFWQRRLIWGAGASGIIWAGGSLMLMWGSDIALQLFTAFLMAGMVAGAVPILAADRLAFRVFGWPIILAVTLGSLGSDPIHIAFSVMSVLFLLGLTRSADYFHDTLHESFRLEHEKDALVADLQNAKLIAENSTRAKTEFLANISHELRTPLNGILGLGELLSLENLTPDQQALLSPLRSSADQLMEIINHLIELSTLEAGHVKLMHSPFPTTELLDSLLASQRPLAMAKGLRLDEKLDPALPPIMSGDIERLRQIFAHLVGNAIKFTEQGSITVSAEVREKTADSARVEFCIADTGPGISADKLALLNNLLMQVDGSSARRHGGIGVGLPIVRKLIELMGGQLRIDSKVGVGSRFCFTLPFEITTAAVD